MNILHTPVTHTTPGTEHIYIAIEQITSVAAVSIGYLGVAIMCAGALKSLWRFLLDFVEGDDNITQIRVNLAKHLSLGLEFLVGKDIIETIIQPTFHSLLLLAAIIVIRTVIAHILSHELSVAIHEIREETEFEIAADRHENTHRELYKEEKLEMKSLLEKLKNFRRKE